MIEAQWGISSPLRTIGYKGQWFEKVTASMNLNCHLEAFRRQTIGVRGERSGPAMTLLLVIDIEVKRHNMHGHKARLVFPGAEQVPPFSR